MTNELFIPYAEVISDVISKADTAEKQMCCSFIIDHFENDYLYKHFDGKLERIQQLRDQLQEKHDELNRSKETVTSPTGVMI